MDGTCLLALVNHNLCNLTELAKVDPYLAQVQPRLLNVLYEDSVPS